MNRDTKNPQDSFKSTVLKRIDEEKVCPRSRLFFHSRECFVWFFWFVSVLIGALAIAVTEFVVGHHQYALYELTHSSYITFLVDIIPYVWIVAFAVMTIVAVYNLKHTKRGYRWPVWMILASSMVLSFFGGTLMNILGFGHELDKQVGLHMSVMYTSQKDREMGWWQSPAEGRLVGVQVHTTMRPTSTLIFEDIHKKRWVVEISDLTDTERELLGSADEVRLMGMYYDDPVESFRACGAFLSADNDALPGEQRFKEKQEIIDRLRRYERLEQEREVLLESTSIASTSLPKATVCGEMKVLGRLSS